MKLGAWATMTGLCLMGMGATVPAAALPISGRQYLVLRSGPQPIADNEIVFIPCAPINNNCREILETYRNQKQQVDQALQLRSDRYYACVEQKSQTECAAILREAVVVPPGWLGAAETARSYLLSANQVQQSQTNAQGEFRFDCPTQNCLVFSTGTVSGINGVWLQLLRAGKVTNLANPNAIEVGPPLPPGK